LVALSNKERASASTFTHHPRFRGGQALTEVYPHESWPKLGLIKG